MGECPLAFGHLGDGKSGYYGVRRAKGEVRFVRGILPMIAILLAVTERQLVEAALRKTEAWYRQLVEQVPSVVYSAELGFARRWFYVSPNVEMMLGFPLIDAFLQLIKSNE